MSAILGASMMAWLPADAKTLHFAGHGWTVRANGVGAPRANRWCEGNAFVDATGQLHLKLTHSAAGWCSAEIISTDRMGFGAYQWQVKGRLDLLDKNVVFGLFGYGTPDVGPDNTNEIDIEFTKWTKATNNGLNYSVYPAKRGIAYTTYKAPITLRGDESTHRFVWSARGVHFQSIEGYRDNGADPIADWSFAPPDPKSQVGQRPVPVEINLWTAAPPSDPKPVELIVAAFTFTPAPQEK